MSSFARRSTGGLELRHVLLDRALGLRRRSLGVLEVDDGRQRGRDGAPVASRAGG